MMRVCAALPAFAVAAVLLGNPPGASPAPPGPAPPAAETIPVSGRVTALGGAPLAGAEVALVPRLGSYATAASRLGGPTGPAVPQAAARARTGADGRFALRAPGAGMWSLTVEAKGYLPMEAALEPLLEERELPAVALPPDAGLAVRVVDEAGRPLAARLAAIATSSRGLFRSGGPGWGLSVRRAAAGEDGAARLPRGAGERLRLLAAAPGRPPVGLDVDAGTARVVLPPGAPRTLRALDERGRPAPETLVLAAGGSGQAERGLELPLGRTDEAGRLAVALPPGGAVLLRLEDPAGRTGALRLAAPAPGSAPGAGPASSSGRVSGEPGAVETTVRLEAPRTASGRVIDRASRLPLAGALVWTAGDPAAFVRTDRTGGYAVRLPRGQVSLQAAARGYLPLADLGAVRPPAGPTLALAPAAAVEGTVVDAAGRPVEGAEVGVAPGSGDFMVLMRLAGRGMLSGRLVVRSAASGRFRLGGLPAGLGGELTASRKGLVPAHLTLEELRPFETRTGLRLVLAAGRSGAGRVVDRGGQPVAGARVTLTAAAPDDRTGLLLRRLQGAGDGGRLEAATDAAGRFEVVAIEPGRYDLAAEAAGFAPVEVPGIEVPAGEGTAALGTVTLSPGAALEGRVRDAAGRPVAGAEVRTGRVREDRFPFPRFLEDDDEPARATTDADGGFAVRDLVPGKPVSLTVAKPGYAEERLASVSAPAAAPLEVVLRRAGRIAGRVVDPDGKPVEGAGAHAQREGSTPFDSSFHLAESDVDGRFELEDVEPGRVTLEVEASGFLPYRLGLEVPPGGDLEGLAVTLEPGAVVEGRVLGADGLPVVGVFVTGRGEGGRGGTRLDAVATTDGDGRYRLDRVRTGPLTLAADDAERGRASREIDVRTGVNTADLVLEAGYEVSGRVVDAAGEPVAGADLRLYGMRVSFDLPRATSAADGSFSFPSVSPGTYDLAGSKDAARVTLDGQVEVKNAPVAGLVARIAAGRVTLTGKLRGLAPRDLAGVEVEAVGPKERRPGKADFRGGYTVEGLTAGDWQVTAEISAAGRQARGTVSIPEGADQASLDLDFGGGFTLTGRASRRGEPLASASVELFQEGDLRRVSADPAGAFRFDDLEAGHYRLSLADRDSGLRHSREIDLTGDLDLEISLDGARLAGRVRDALDGKPIERASLELLPADPAADAPPGMASYRRAESDSRGAFSFGEVERVPLRLVVTAGGYGRLERTVDLAGERGDDLDLQLSPTEGIRFEAIGPSGLPADAVLLAVVGAAGQVVADGMFTPGEGGAVRVSTVPAGSWTLVVAAGLGGAALERAITAPGTLGRLQLPPGGSVEVAVPDLAAGGGGTATVAGPDGRPYRRPGWGGRLEESWPLTAGRATLRGLPAGRCTVTVTAADGRTWKGTADVPAGGEAELTLR